MGGSSAYYIRCKVFSDWSIINMGIYLLHFLKQHLTAFYFYFFELERSGSVVECLTRDRRAAGLSLTGVTALWSLSKKHLS